MCILFNRNKYMSYSALYCQYPKLFNVSMSIKFNISNKSYSSIWKLTESQKPLFNLCPNINVALFHVSIYAKHSYINREINVSIHYHSFWCWPFYSWFYYDDMISIHSCIQSILIFYQSFYNHWRLYDAILLDTIYP